MTSPDTQDTEELTSAMLDRLRDSQAIPQPNGRVEVDCDALCDVLVAGHTMLANTRPDSPVTVMREALEAIKEFADADETQLCWKTADDALEALARISR